MGGRERWAEAKRFSASVVCFWEKGEERGRGVERRRRIVVIVEVEIRR